MRICDRRGLSPIGQAGYDKIYGRAGNDIIDGGSEADAMDGGEGDDIYFDWRQAA